MTDMEKLLMVYGSVFFCLSQYTYNQDVYDEKKLKVLANQVEILLKKLEALDLEEILACGQKDFYSFL